MRRLVDHRWLALLGLVIVLAALAPGLTRAIHPNNSLDVWFLEEDPNVEAYRTFQETFGNDEVVLVHVRESAGVFRRGALERIERASGRLESIEGVARVDSVLSAKHVEPPGAGEALALLGAGGDADGSQFVEPLVPRPIPSDPETLEQIEDRALANPLVRGNVVDADATEAMLVVAMAKMEDFDAERDRIVGEVREAVTAVYGDGARLGGVGVIYSALNALTQRDFGLFLVVGYLLMFLALWWLFRSKYLVAAALGVVGGATTFALAALGSAGHRLNMITVLLPTLIIVLGIADAVHFPVAYRRALADSDPGDSRREVVVRALAAAARPCLMTSLTTMASFAALASSRMGGLRQLGIYAAVGIGSAFVVSLVAMAIALMRRDIDADRTPREIPVVDGALTRVRGWLENRRPALLAATLVVGSLAIWGLTQLDVDTYTLGYLPDDHRVVREHESIEESWGPYMPLELTVEPAGDRRYESAELLEATETFVERAETHPRIGDGIHLTQLYRYALSRVNPGRESGADLTADQVELVRSRLPGGVRSRFVDRDRGVGRITLSAEMMSAAELRTTIDDLHGVASEVFAGRAQVRASGYLPVYASVVDYIVDSQIRSFLIALLLIFALMVVWMRSFRLALISLVPNLFPVLIMLGTMGALGLALDAATAVLAALVLGIAIDDTIHFLHHWREAEEAGLNWHESVEHTLQTAGPAICATSLLLLVGFPVLMLASIKTVVYFGLLTTVAAVAAAVGDLVVLPLLLRVVPGASGDA